MTKASENATRPWWKRAHPGPALLSFVVYFAASTWIGETFPFSRYEMYAYTGYREGAVLQVEVDGRVVPMRSVHAFVGIDPADLEYGDDAPYGQEYLLDQLRHYVTTHSVAEEQARMWGPGRPVRLGYRIIRSTPDGPSPDDALTVLAEGRAWPRD